MGKVLVVDDDPDFVSVTSKVLEKAGHSALSAERGAKALQAMRQTPPDVALLDIMMSYILDGLDVSCQMAEDPELKGVPVILATSLTGAKENGLLTKDEHIPVEEWLSKPVDPEKLLLRVDGVLS